MPELFRAVLQWLFSNYGRCVGNNYVLPHDIGEPPGTQANWEYCINCCQLFYNGWAPQRGVCFRYGGPHVPDPGAFHFAIPVSSYQ
ncbi:hypothetical protein [Micromonospora sp. 050-3]|uniref:hypothetical protein n=1 Tax=Micromonospora sp. 050-3 TaxID=2789265 RepID=UPI00397A086B